MNQRMKSFLLILILMGGGVMFVIFGALRINRQNHYPKIEATISRYEWTGTDTETMTDQYDCYVTYTVDGVAYEARLDESLNLEVGETVTVQYNPDKPGEIIGSSKTVSYVVLGVGILFFLGGCAALVKFLAGR